MRPQALSLRRLCVSVAVVMLFTSAVVRAQDDDTPPDNAPHDFAISRAWLEALRAQKTFLPTRRVEMEHRPNAGVNGLAKDCEMHMAARLVGERFGEPPFLVVEPPNLCRFKPNNATPTTTTPNVIWKNLFDTSMKGKECDVTGFPRLYTEHMGEGGGSSPSNPAHVLEIHPATRIACDGQKPVDFTKNFRTFEGLTHIQPASAHTCLSTLRIWVKYHAADNQYEFVQRRSGKCGNLAIVEVTGLPREWIQETGGGRTAIGRITPNGDPTGFASTYTVEPELGRTWCGAVGDYKGLGGCHRDGSPGLIARLSTTGLLGVGVNEAVAR